MPTYKHVADTFKALLKASRTFQGRFQLMPHWGTELNSNTLGALLDETLNENPKAQFPLVAMMPPRSRSEYQDSDADVMDVTLLFLTTTYYEGSSVKDRNRATGTSTRTIADDWDQMRDCAIDFLKTLGSLTLESAQPGALGFYIASGAQAMQPISTIGTKRLSGVMLQLSLFLGLGCDPPADYPDYGNINLSL